MNKEKHMEKYPWWTDKQIKLADEAKQFTDEVLIPIGERNALKNKFNWEAIKLMADQGWFGALVPQKYGGHFEDWGITGAAILNEEAARAGVVGPLGTTMFGSATQLVHNGSEEQKAKWLPPMIRGELLGCITMTEPYAGSDIASIESTAVRDGNPISSTVKKGFKPPLPPPTCICVIFKQATSRKTGKLTGISPPSPWRKARPDSMWKRSTTSSACLPITTAI